MAKKTKLPPAVMQHLIERRAEVAAYLDVAIKFNRKIKIKLLTETLKDLDKLLAISE